MSMPNALVTAQIPRPIDSQSGNDKEQGRSETPWRTHDSETFRELQQRTGQLVRDPAREQMLELVRPTPGSCRISSGDEHRAEHDKRKRADGHASDFDEPIQPAVGSIHAGIEKQHKRRQQHHARHRVQQPLDDDRRERRGCAEPFLARKQVRPDHLSRACRQHRARRKPDRRGAKCRPEPGMTDRFEQVLPAERPEDHRQHRNRCRQRDQPRISVLDLRPDDIQMRAPKEQRKQANREDDDDGGLQGFLH